MATSRALNVDHLALWAKRKGIHVLGTGDFTHPKWREELARDLYLDEESGLYRRRQVKKEAGIFVDAPEPYFCLQAEISSIYKKNGKTRKVHNLVYVPDLETADKLASKLAVIGNINSDGRPILGLDSHDLLELVLESSPCSVLIPAHIWTPWFSLFGSKSGFDRLEDCYEDLSSHIFALETGLSSDPAMNRHLSALDGYALISNSDAHSGPNLGREANLFSGSPSYDSIFRALRSAAKREDHNDVKFLGTCEFYPEEGKYHLDGHRACGVVLEPWETVKCGNLCPVCGKPLTIGVLHRVMELADRLEPAQLPNEPESRMLVPLPETLSQILGQKPTSRKVQERYERCLQELGSEMDILCQLPEAEIRAYWDVLGEAVSRLRAGKVNVNAGFDGQYGVINIFSPEEQKELHKGKFHSLPGINEEKRASRLVQAREKRQMARITPTQEDKAPSLLSKSQQVAVNAGPAPVFVIAGPGAGKTRCLVNRILLLAENTAADKILALTFTRRAAEEMLARLEPFFQSQKLRPFCDTLHALAWKILNEKYSLLLLNEADAESLFLTANPYLPQKEASELWKRINLCREKCQDLSPELQTAYANYVERKKADPAIRLVDFSDLLELLSQEDLRGKWQHILVDEMQDLSPLQIRLIESLCPLDGKGFFGIGDPDQSIYSFRGACGNILTSLQALWDKLEIHVLEESWRSPQKILDMARSSLGSHALCPALKALSRKQPDLRLLKSEDDRGEASAIAKKIASLLGPTAHSLLDLHRNEDALAASDIAILVRLKAQIPIISKSLAAQGIPFNAPSTEEFWHDQGCQTMINYARNIENPPSPELLVSSEEFAQIAKNKNFAALKSYWRKCGGWEQFFAGLAWLQEAELLSAKSQAVRILTIHAAKGLEFHTVFIPGLEDGLLPLNRSLLKFSKLDAAAEDEEKRLLYVALTRASHALYLSYSGSRYLYGQKLELAPSPFIATLETFCEKRSLTKHWRKTSIRLNLLGNSQDNKE